MIPPDAQKKLSELERRILLLEKEIASGHARMQSEVRGEIAGMLAGIQAHVDASVMAALKPLLERLEKIDKLPNIADDVRELKSAAQEARDYRKEREGREKAVAELQATANVQKTLADVKLLSAQIVAYPGESIWRRRAPVLTLIGAVIAALCALIAAAIHSH